MTDKEKAQKIGVARNAIRAVKEDTDEDLWAHLWLWNALHELDKWLEEAEI